MTKSNAGVVEEKDPSRKKRLPARGKRYSSAVKKKTLAYAQEHGVKSAADKHGVTESSIYEWIRAAKRRGNETTNPKQEEQNPREDRDRRVLAMWRRQPGYGPSQIRNMLKRGGFRVSVGTVRHVLEENGYLPPKLKRKEHVGRYEAGWPLMRAARFLASPHRPWFTTINQFMMIGDYGNI